MALEWIHEEEPHISLFRFRFPYHPSDLRIEQYTTISDHEAIPISIETPPPRHNGRALSRSGGQHFDETTCHKIASPIYRLWLQHENTCIFKTTASTPSALLTASSTNDATHLFSSPFFIGGTHKQEQGQASIILLR